MPLRCEPAMEPPSTDAKPAIPQEHHDAPTEPSANESVRGVTKKSPLFQAMTRIREHKHFWVFVSGAIGFIIALALGLGLGLHFGLNRDKSDNHGPVIDLGYARYRGTYLNNGVSEFLGIRYARPPTGDLRWRAPVEPKSEDSIQKAKKFGPRCIGISQAISDDFDEDCLTAYIWGPTNATADMKLPVMVFIQGGGYTVNANGNWNGSQLVETSGNNIVYVGFNYRVGLFGFLAGEDVRRDGDLNVGLLDQRFLLQWVQKHISSFGGDPGHVVIQGASAGAGSVALQLTAYGGRDDGLYVGAISESTFLPAHPPVNQLEWQLNHTMEQAGCQSSNDRMGCLRGMEKKHLQQLNVAIPFPQRVTNPLFYWTPCIDGDLLQELPSAMFAAGKFRSVPALMGTCTNEGTTFVPDAASKQEVIDTLVDNFPRLNSSHDKEITSLYPLETPLPHHNDYFPSLARAYGEATFICPTRTILNALHDSSAPTWSYRYNVEEDDSIARGIGVYHIAEAPAVWGPDMLPSAHPSYLTYNADAVPLLMYYWLSFVRFLDPNRHRMTGAPTWDSWGRNESRIVLQVPRSTMENVTLQERDRCNFWQSIGSVINQK